MANEIITIPEIKEIANSFAQSGFFGYKNPAEAFTLMVLAQANGLHPAKAAERYHIIQGRPAMKADAMLAAFQEAGGSVKWIKRTDTEAKLWLSHPNGGELEVTWNMERAKNAGLAGKDNWKKFPAQMLSARCVSEGVRALFPACLCGMYTPEEVQDFDRPAAPQAESVAPKAEPKKTKKAEAPVVDAEIVNEQAQTEQAQEPADDPRKKAEFVKAMAQLKATHNATYEEIMTSYGYGTAADVEPEKRKEIFRTIQAEINKETV